MKTRFCPSPTGLIHLGNTRTALFNYLLAHKQQGQFLLRIEDTDVERSKQEYVEALEQDLQWLGLPWDEGPGQDGGLGPYYQSKRQAVYDQYYQQLIKTNSAYPCFCSEEELAVTRKIQRSSGKPPRYAGSCRDLSTEQIAEKTSQGIKPTLRFRVKTGQRTQFTDLVRGEQNFLNDDISDFIIRRANGTAPFMFCNAVDDAMMKVTHVLRGEDHLTNTPRQMMILQALNLPLPQYGHIALIVGNDGSPLSKRHGSKNVGQLREEGYLAIAINNYLARLGHYYGHDDLLSLAQLAEQFSMESLAKSPAKFNVEQLNYWQKEAVAQLDNTQLWDWLDADIAEQIPQQKRDLLLETIRPNIRFSDEANHWARIILFDLPPIEEQQVRILEQAGVDYFTVAIAAVDAHGNQFSDVIKHIRDDLDISGKALYQPLRVALTGVSHGPELAKIMQLMDVSVIKQRLEEAR